MKQFRKSTLLISSSFCLAIMIMSVCSFGQRTGHSKNHIKFNPVLFLVPAFNINYERFIKDNQSLQIGMTHMDRAYFRDTEMNGRVISLDYKCYYRNDRTKRSYFLPYLRYQNMEYLGNGDIIKQKEVGGGVCAGKVFYLTEWLVADLNLGLNFIPTSYKTIYTDGIVDVEAPITLYGLGPRIGLLIGISF